jgi:dihydroxyacetone kinase-like protein
LSAVKTQQARKSGASKTDLVQAPDAMPLRYGDDPYVWACWLYYEDGMTQGDIADVMGISRATVNSYLAEARERGIVNIAIEPARLASLTVAQELKRHFGLADCLVVPSEDTARPLIDRIGVAGGQALHRLVKSGDTIAVSWGRTVLAIAERAEVHGLQDVTVVQATGGTRASFAYTPELCAAALASAVNGKLINIAAPAIVSTNIVREALLQEPLIANQFEMLGGANKALFGISSLRPNSTIHTSGFFESVSLQEYLAKGAVGVVAGRFIDGQGRAIDGPLDDRTIGISLDMLKNIGLRIAAAGGFDKVPAILAALRGGYVNVLITDAATGRGILNADGVTDIDQRLSQRLRPDSQAPVPSAMRTRVKKFLNDPDKVVEEMLDGVVRAHRKYLVALSTSRTAH